MKWIWPVLVALSILGVGLLLTGVMENRYIYFATYVILQYIVIATACSPVPEGRATWTARMLANRLVELQVVECVSEDTILRVLKKASSSRGGRSRGAFPRA